MMAQSDAEISVHAQYLPQRIFLFCPSVELLLVLLDALVNYGRLVDVGPIRRLFNIAREDGLAQAQL